MQLLVHASQTLVRYIVWLLLFVIGLWAMLETRINVFDILVQLRASGWVVPAVTNFYVVAAILIWLAIAVWLENYLTEPKDIRVFWRRKRPRRCHLWRHSGRLVCSAGADLASVRPVASAAYTASYWL